MSPFAIFGWLVALAGGLYLIVGGIGGLRLGLGFAGRVDTLSLSALLLGTVIVGVAVWYAPIRIIVA